MTARTPFKVVAYEPGGAHVIARRPDGYQIGFVLKNFGQEWEALLHTGVASINNPQTIGYRRTRAEAAELVWRAWERRKALARQRKQRIARHRASHEPSHEPFVPAPDRPDAHA